MSEMVLNGVIMRSEEINLCDLTPIEVPVKLVKDRQHVIIEASHAAARKYRGAALMGAEMAMSEGGESTLKKMEGMSDSESLLISLCLFEVAVNGDGKEHRKPVTRQFVDGLLDRQTKVLADRIKEISPSLVDGGDLTSLRKQRDKLNLRIKRLEDAEPKKLPSSGEENFASLTS